MEKSVIVIVGPTCSGKTDLGINLAQKFGTEIISADSRQIYKYLDIGTAKPSLDELKLVKHHFIDELAPDVNYNISKFEIDSLKICEDLFAKSKIPIVVGGSGLYVNAIVDGIFDTVDTDEEYRKLLHKWRDEHGNEFLYEELQKVDPVSAEKMLPQNWKRVMRALEVFHLSGKPIWKHHEDFERESDIEFLLYGLRWDRKILYSNIELRVDKMIEAGLVEEVKKTLEMGYSKNVNALNTVGYKEIIEFLEDKINLERAIELIKRNTRRFAKRQLTWFRRDERIKWFDVACKSDFDEIANSIYNEISD
ncbi:MAG: tRNA (adenosine(37)-N6)-dimethylallyltransferase MiaA [Melioribacteraceae bacterium]|nr:tRNA (adenosine(37)-N6)-dimethylallyltransferase MiaA [Melioribacteraceae bacterium]